MGLTLALYIYVTVVLLSLLVRLLTMGAGVVPNTLVGSWEPTPHPGLPWSTLILEEVLSLRAT